MTNDSSPTNECSDKNCKCHRERGTVPVHDFSPAGWIERFYDLYVEGRKLQKAPQSYIDYFQARKFFLDEFSQRDAELVEAVEKLDTCMCGGGFAKKFNVFHRNDCRLSKEGFSDGLNEALQIIKGTRNI